MLLANGLGFRVSVDACNLAPEPQVPKRRVHVLGPFQAYRWIVCDSSSMESIPISFGASLCLNPLPYMETGN